MTWTFALIVYLIFCLFFFLFIVGAHRLAELTRRRREGLFDD